MPILIRPQGRFFPIDPKGYIINDTTLESIPRHWQNVLNRIIKEYQNHLGNELDSIYLRGSLARGTQIDGFSDIDTFALIHRPNVRWEVAKWQEKFESELQSNYTFVKKVETMLSSYSEKLEEKYPVLAMQIKTQSLCLHGNDFGLKLPKYKPSKSMMLSYQWLEIDLKEFDHKETISHESCQHLMKTIIRTGFELIMIQEGRFTPDLFLCCQTFSKYYPDYEKEMNRALHFYLNPSKEKEQLIPIIDTFGKWLINRVNKDLK